jgi:hypothetical protein
LQSVSPISSHEIRLETPAKLLIILVANTAGFSKRLLRSLNNQTDFDSAIRRFDPSRPSQFSEAQSVSYIFTILLF